MGLGTPSGSRGEIGLYPPGHEAKLHPLGRVRLSFVFPLLSVLFSCFVRPSSLITPFILSVSLTYYKILLLLSSLLSSFLLLSLIAIYYYHLLLPFIITIYYYYLLLPFITVFYL
ncbi:hypothetical protein F4860DRAFT_475190 [Xylaria cubensis]|nr:hypothetical protein F4860DRAFT_475190 [Xylaria cubensis]